MVTYQVTLTLIEFTTKEESTREMEYFKIEDALEYVDRCFKNYRSTITSVVINRVDDKEEEK